MESRIKERLTGALILVAALVVLVPEIFSGKPRSEQPVEEPAAGAASATEGPPLRTYTSDPDAAAAPLVQVPEIAATESPDPVASEPMPPVAGPPPAVPAQDGAATPAPAEKAPAAASGEWYVQVGSFSQLANAQRYAQALRGQGFEAEVLPASGSKALIRVRVGPTRSRAAATQLLTRLGAAGHKGAVIGP